MQLTLQYSVQSAVSGLLCACGPPGPELGSSAKSRVESGGWRRAESGGWGRAENRAGQLSRAEQGRRGDQKSKEQSSSGVGEKESRLEQRVKEDREQRRAGE